MSAGHDAEKLRLGRMPMMRAGRIFSRYTYRHAQHIPKPMLMAFTLLGRLDFYDQVQAISRKKLCWSSHRARKSRRPYIAEIAAALFRQDAYWRAWR